MQDLDIQIVKTTVSIYIKQFKTEIVGALGWGQGQNEIRFTGSQRRPGRGQMASRRSREPKITIYGILLLCH